MASPALNEPKYNKDGSKISYFRSIMGYSFDHPLHDVLQYEWKTRQLFVYSKATGKIRQVTPENSVILGSDWYGGELYFIGSIGSQTGLWHADKSGQVNQLHSFDCTEIPDSIASLLCNTISGSVEVSPNGKYIAFSKRDSENGTVGIARLK